MAKEPTVQKWACLHLGRVEPTEGWVLDQWGWHHSPDCVGGEVMCPNERARRKMAHYEEMKNVVHPNDCTCADCEPV